MALMKYSLALKSGMTEQEAFDATMRNASVAAQQYAQTMYITGESVTEFTTKQKMDEIALMSQNKSFANVRSIINTYNGGLSQLGVTQQQFTQSVSQGNSVLGNYIASVGVGNAKMRHYIGSLIATKAATCSPPAHDRRRHPTTTDLHGSASPHTARKDASPGLRMSGSCGFCFPDRPARQSLL